MPRRKPKRTRSFSHSRPQNPNTMPEEDEEPLTHSQDENPNPQPDEEEDEAEQQQQQQQQQQEAEEPQFLSHDSNPNPLPRRGGKRKKPTRKQRDAIEKKLRLLRENLRPTPFSPIKTLDLCKHESLLKTLGLWDFALLDLGRDAIRSDLLELLIANFDSAARCSYVKDHRINVSRADLARALKLPVKREKAETGPASEDSVAFVSEFVSNYMLLHEDDAWMMPQEVLDSERLVKEGQFQKVDWAGLMWFMVEKELVQVPDSGFCYYASHLQYLIRSQKPDLFKEEDADDVSIEEDEDAGAAKTESLEDFEGDGLESQHVELSLGQENGEGEDAGGENMDLEGCKEEPGQWFFNEGSTGVDHSLRHCSLNPLDNSECDPVDKEVEEERYDPAMKFAKLERLESSEFITNLEASNVSYGLAANLIDPSSSGLLTPRTEMHKNLLLNAGGLPMFGNACRREMDDEDVVRQLPHVDHDRKMKANGSWGHTQDDFFMYMEEAQSWLNRARVMHEQKEEGYTRARMNVEYLASQVQDRDNMICSMEKTLVDEQNKRQVEIYRLERELCIMTQLLYGYKKALKETRTAFAEYRERFRQPDEPIYKDVGGNGVVLSIMELEKQRLEKEEERRKMRYAMEEKLKAFEQDWLGKFDAHHKQVDLLHKRLLGIVEEVGRVKENSKTEQQTSK